jgi:uncharacterized protein (TIGR03085 family)
VLSVAPVWSGTRSARARRSAARTVVDMSLARTERAALADLFEQVGPDRPTLCEGWQTLDLLIHLLVRERDPLGAVGTRVKPLHGFTEHAADRFRAKPWDELVRAYRSGPPGWNPAGWGPINDLFNGGEMFIHHEDVRRAQPGWQPREMSPADTKELVGIVRSGMSKLVLRKSGVGILARIPGADPITLRAGEPIVTLVGDPGEIVLWVSGRDAVGLDFDGDEAAVGQVRTLQRGF